jgi:hypothetical protein
VYRYNNTYVFVYQRYATPSTKSTWTQVRVAFSSTQINTRVYHQSLVFGGSFNSLLLENNGQIPSNVKLSLAECPKWKWSCNNRPNGDKCSSTTPVTICEPSISTPLITPYPTTSKNSGLTAAVYTITDNRGEHFFTDGQFFTFLYYVKTNGDPVVTSIQKQLQIYPSVIESIGGMYMPMEVLDPKAQQSPSSLLSPMEDNAIGGEQVIEGMYESLTSAVKSTSYRIPNMPLQTWTHVLINVTGRNITVYINGQIRTAYITPDIPNQMNQLMQLTNSPTFTGWTSQLNYLPFGVSSEEAQQIYSNGYLGKSYQTTGGWWGFFNRYSLKVIFVDNIRI